MAEHTAFFYGTLMAPKVLHRVCHGTTLPTPTQPKRNLHVRPGLLQHHRRHRVGHADYPAVLPRPGSTVRGMLVSGLTDGDLWRLDIFEGSEYERRSVEVREIREGAGEGEPELQDLGRSVQAETYIWVGPESDLEEREWDFEEFVREKMGAWTGETGVVRDDVKEVDDAAAAKEGFGNDPTRGRGLDGKIGKALEEELQKDPRYAAAI